MVLLYILLTVYIIAVNFYAYRFIREQRDSVDAGEPAAGDGKIFLSAILGGAVTLFASLLIMKYRRSSFVLMVFLPLLAVLNIFCFYLGYRSIWLFL